MKYSIEAWIYDPIAKEILLLKVKTGQCSFWQPITGGIESDESPEAACIREIFEETGLEIELTKLLKISILQSIITFYNIRKSFQIEIRLKQEYAMSGMPYNVGVLIIGRIFLNKKLYIQIYLKD